MNKREITHLLVLSRFTHNSFDTTTGKILTTEDIQSLPSRSSTGLFQQHKVMVPRSVIPPITENGKI